MKMSCNGCRVLRKGCSDDCVIRPSLTWIKSSESQANATMFLAKFYGRAGLVNLLSAAPEHNRAAVFRSLLYEACGRIINPVYGSVGLLWSGNWTQCQSAVNAVLKGSATAQFLRHPTLDGPAGTPQPFPALKSYDIRHVPKTASKDLHKLRSRPRFKHSLNRNDVHLDGLESKSSRWLYPPKFNDEAIANDTWTSRFQDNRVSPEGDSVFSVETVEAFAANRYQPAAGQLLKLDGRPMDDDDERESQVKLELTLGSSAPPLRQGGCESGIARC